MPQVPISAFSSYCSTGYLRQNSRTSSRRFARADSSSHTLSPRSMKSAIFRDSSSLAHRVVMAGIPRRSPDGLNGGFGSSGTVDLLVLIPISSSVFSALRPFILVPWKSMTMILFSVPQVTRLYPRERNSCAIAWLFLMI